MLEIWTKFASTSYDPYANSKKA